MKKLFLCILLSVVLAASVSRSGAQTSLDYDARVQQGKTELQAGSAEQALKSGQAAIKMSANRWEGYALIGGALMNLKRYEEAADALSKAIDRAPEAKQPALRDLRRQSLLAQSGSPAANTSTPTSPTSQAEIVLWKSIENSANPADFQSYLDKYPQGAFEILARRHLAETLAQREQDKQNGAANATAGAGQAEGLAEQTVRAVDFRRANDGAGRVVVQLTDSRNPINVRQNGNQIVVDFTGTLMPKNLLRRYDVTDFATPVQTIEAAQVRGTARLVITAKGNFEQAVSRTDNIYTMEIRPSANRTVADEGRP